MALEERVFVSIPVAHESSDAVEFGFVAADPRARPQEIVERHLGDRAKVISAEVEPHPPVFGLANWCIELGFVDVDRAGSKNLSDHIK